MPKYALTKDNGNSTDSVETRAVKPATPTGQGWIWCDYNEVVDLPPGSPFQDVYTPAGNPDLCTRRLPEPTPETVEERVARLKKTVRNLLELYINQGVDGPRNDSYPTRWNIGAGLQRLKASTNLTSLYSVPTLINGLQGLNNSQIDELTDAAEGMMEVCNKRGQELYLDINTAEADPDPMAALDVVEADLNTVLTEMPADIHDPAPGGWPPPPTNAAP